MTTKHTETFSGLEMLSLELAVRQSISEREKYISTLEGVPAMEESVHLQRERAILAKILTFDLRGSFKVTGESM